MFYSHDVLYRLTSNVQVYSLVSTTDTSPITNRTTIFSGAFPLLYHSSCTAMVRLNHIRSDYIAFTFVVLCSFYCILLLSAMFMSSCYWPPVPLDTPLARPWSQNITTFSDALHSLIPDVPEEMIPAAIPIVERCWCEFSTSGFFEPYNVTEWELNSVTRLAEDIQKKMEEEMSKTDPSQPTATTSQSPLALANVGEAAQFNPSPSRWSRIRDILWPFSSGTHEPANVPEELPSDVVPLSDSSDFSANDTQVPATAVPSEKPWLRREYDLREYGFAVSVDFGWSPRPVAR